MATNGRKIPLPRKLDPQESAASLRLWKIHFVNYTRSDPYFAHFVRAEVTWVMAADNWGFVAETAEGSLKRTGPEMKSDCLMFLETLASYLPDDYLVDNITTKTKCLKDVWKEVDNYYGTALSSFTFLELAGMTKKKEETHRQFYMRLEGYVSKHLAEPGVKVEDVTSPETGDILTISLKNVLVIMWMSKIHRKLVDFVRVDYASELKAGKQLIELMGRIADNVDSILARHDQAGTVSFIQDGEETDEDMHSQAGAVCRTEGNYTTRRPGNKFTGNRGGFANPGPRNRDRPRDSKAGKTLHCPKCQYLSEALKLRISTNHEPTECFRKDFQVRQVSQDYDTAEEYSDSEFVGQFPHTQYSSPDNLHFQSDNWAAERGEQMSHSCIQMVSSSENLPLSDQEIRDSVLKIQQSRYQEDSGTAQASSPTIKVAFRGNITDAAVDEGANINCMALRLALSSDLEIEPTSSTAKGADSNALRVVGKAKKPVRLQTVEGGIPITLKHVIIVDGLSADILIGEPGKRDCHILTNATNRTITIHFQTKDYIFPYSKARAPSSMVARVPASTFISPGINYKWRVPERLQKLTHLQLQPRRVDRPWFRPGVCQIQEGYIFLKNISEEPVSFKRGAVFGEVRLVSRTDVDCQPVTKGKTVNKVRSTYPDPSQYVSHRDPELAKANHVDKIKLDPDNVLTREEKEQFRQLCSEFTDVLRPEPGRYNGYAGHVDNKINFLMPPAPNKVIYQQKLTEPMKKLLGEKMDKLRSFGVLRFPEEVGVTPEFVSPSMLLPKQEPGEWRLVTDLSGLNKFTKKPEGKHPTIQEAKEFLAKKKYAIHVDLSNFFYQSGMEREDIQYLATVHPFDGLMVYVCEPMGLNGAPEHSYELLARVFGTLIKDGRMVRMADGLHIGCDSVEEGLESLRMLLELCRKSGLTLKPSKVEIFPTKCTLFGWELDAGWWKPTAHTTNTLSRAPLPKTVKQLRGFLGAFKQFSKCVQSYGPLLSQLEAMTGSHRPSGEVINWSEEQKKAFDKAREAAKNVEAYSIPRPSDQLFVYSDYSREHRAVGGKLEFERTEAGVTKRHLAGHFSVMVDSYKANWWPCEGEALAARLVLEAFKHYILENNNTTVHFTDNRPVVDAWNMARKGGFSSNARVATFLVSVANLPIEIRHKAGKNMETSDYASRHPITCKDKCCALCKFAYNQQMVGDNCEQLVREITVEDVTSGRVTMPCTSRKAWLSVQQEDKVHVKLRAMLEVGQAPHKKQTKGDHNKLKLLHNLYLRGELRVEQDGLVVVKQHGGDKSGWVISVPNRLFAGLCQALHLRFNHPSKAQLTQLVARHFYTPGYQAIINETVDQCSQCLSLKTLPKVLKDFSTTPLGSLGEKFSTDVLMRANQKFLVTVEDLSGFAWVNEISDQKADSIGPALLEQILPIIPEHGAVIRSDGASAFKTLKAESETEGSTWKKHCVKIELGQALNVNKNPVAENGIKRVEREILRHGLSGQHVTREQMAVISRDLNSRIKPNGLSSREILVSRSNVDNKYINLADRDLAGTKLRDRMTGAEAQVRHKEKRGAKRSPRSTFMVGDLVYIRSAGDKVKARELYIIQGLRPRDNIAVVRKQQDQLQAKTYDVDISDLISNSCYRPGPPSADMSKTEKDRSENQIESEDEEEMKEKTCKKEKKSPKKVIPKVKDQRLKPAGTSMGAPTVNAAGRPMRRAARKAIEAKAWLNNIVMSNVTKHPWLQEDQPSEDEDEDRLDYTGRQLRRAVLLQRLRLEQEEAERLDIAMLWAEVEVDHNSDSSSQASRTSGARGTDEEHLTWDDEFEDEVPEAEDEPEEYGYQPYMGPALTDWLPRRLSSEFTNQFEVTHLPNSSGTDEAYFLTDAVFNSDQEQNETASSQNDEILVTSPLARGHISPVTPQQITVPSRLTFSEDASFTAAQRIETGPQLGTRTAGQSRTTPTRSRIPVRTPPPSKQSARLSQKPRRDYKSLHRRGRDQSHNHQ